MAFSRTVLPTRRVFIRNGTLVLTSAATFPAALNAMEPESVFRIGLVTDLHHADKNPAGSRHYRETLGKLEKASAKFAERKPDLLVELGDLIDAADSVALEKRYLRTVNKPFAQICEDRHYVLGNHCVDTLKKEEFLEVVEQGKSYYSFDRAGWHFIVLDSCFRSDGTPYQRRNFKWTDANVPPVELEWLKTDLAKSDKPTVVFAHQRLDVTNNHGVRNNAKVRTILESSGQVRAVFQGHSHRNDLKLINDIPYCTLVAMVEGSGEANNGYSVLEIRDDQSLTLSGFRKQKSYDWTGS